MAAIKVIRPKKKNINPETEKQIHKRLNHQNVVTLYSTGTVMGPGRETHVLCLEYISGGTLYTRIGRKTVMPLMKTKHYFKQLVTGIEYLHTFGVAHRDIKPENLLTTENDILKIADFGFALQYRHKGVETKSSDWCGTIEYMAPEMWNEEGYNPAQTDIWACGVTLTLMLSGLDGKPWKHARDGIAGYDNWKQEKYDQRPWRRMKSDVFSLIRGMLEVCPERRLSIGAVKSHSWLGGSETAEDISDGNEVKKRRV